MPGWAWSLASPACEVEFERLHLREGLFKSAGCVERAGPQGLKPSQNTEDLIAALKALCHPNASSSARRVFQQTVKLCSTQHPFMKRALIVLPQGVYGQVSCAVASMVHPPPHAFIAKQVYWLGKSHALIEY
jgi:hypothetical protein